MLLAARLASVTALIAVGAVTLPAHAAEPTGGAAQSSGTGPEGLTARPGNNTSGDQTLQQAPLPISAPPRIGLFPTVGASLLADGIDIHGIAFDHFLANPSAGVVTGQTTNLAGLRPAADFDLGRLIDLQGGYVHVCLTFFGLRSDIPQIITQTGGFLTGFQTTPATETDLISLLTYEQRSPDQRLSVEVGRTNPFNYFLLPNSLDPFSYYAGTFVNTADTPSLPYPTWGGKVTYKFRRLWYVQAGAFEDNFVAATQYGDRFGIGQSPGAQVLGEVGYRSEFLNAPYPANLELGVEYNTRHGRSNLKGTGAPAIPFLQGADYPGGGVVFFQGEKVLWRGARRRVGPPANVALFGSLNASFDKPQPFDFDTLAGVNFTGFIPGRPFDAIGLQARYQRLSQVEVAAEDFRQLVTTRQREPLQDRNGFAFEVVGNIQATPAIAFRPIFQYFVNPDNYYPPAAPPGRPHDGVEAGFFAVCSLGRLLGTSTKPN